MANLSRILELAEQLNQKDRAAIIALIDVKTEGDMQAVLNKLDVMNSQLNARIDGLETKMDTKLDALETKMDAKIEALEKSVSNIKWFVGIIVALAVAAVRLMSFF